jgi:uncharacterized protein YjiS (DUF1127 family)
MEAVMSTRHFDGSKVGSRVYGWSAVKQGAAEWWRRARSRQELRNLSLADLRDIGITPPDAFAEAAKPFWLA